MSYSFYNLLSISTFSHSWELQCRAHLLIVSSLSSICASFSFIPFSVPTPRFFLLIRKCVVFVLRWQTVWGSGFLKCRWSPWVAPCLQARIWGCIGLPTAGPSNRHRNKECFAKGISFTRKSALIATCLSISRTHAHILKHSAIVCMHTKPVRSETADPIDAFLFHWHDMNVYK